MEADYKIKIILCGDSGVGKSTFFNRLKYDNNNLEITPTIGVDFLTINHVYKDKRIKLHVWDTAGEERYRAIISSYFKDISACIIMFDLTNIKSLESVKYWVSMANKYSSCDHHHPIFLFGNKKDLNYNKQLISENIINKYIRENNILYYDAISSIDCSFDNDIFINFLIDIIISKLDHMCNGITSPHNNSIKLHSLIKKDKPKNCCLFM
jgi:small GTP-binding protein